MLHVYNIVIHSFKGYTPFITSIKYWLISCVLQYILVAYFIYSSLYLLIPCPYIAPPPPHGFKDEKVESNSLFQVPGAVELRLNIVVLELSPPRLLDINIILFLQKRERR